MSLVIPRPRAASGVAAWFAACAAHDLAFGRFQLWLPVLTVAGIFVAAELPFAVPPALSGAALAVLLGLRFAAGRTALFAVTAPPLLAAAALTAGLLALGLQERFGGTPVITHQQTADITGLVVSAEGRGEGRDSVVVALTAATLDGPVPRRIRVSVRGGGPFPAGATVTGKVRLFPLQGPVYPGGYDSSRRLFFDGIGATGFSYGALTVTRPPDRSAAALADALRRTVESRITAALAPSADTSAANSAEPRPAAEPSPAGAAFATALLVGKRGDMAPEDVEALRVSGLGHILAISGLHMALVAGSVFAAVRFVLAAWPAVALRHPIRKWAAVAGVMAATFYLVLSGGSVATIRAYVMLMVGLAAILVDRPALTMRTIAVAAAVVITVDPISVTEPSFQMSFLAVTALVGFYEWWSRRRIRVGTGLTRPVAAFLIGLALTSLIAGLATAPASAYHFHRLAPLGLPANLAAMPIFTFIVMPAGVIGLAVMPLGLEALPLTVMRWGLDLVLAIAHAATEATGDAGLTGAIPPAAAVLTALGLVWLAIFTAPWRLLGLGAIAAGLALAPHGPRYDALVAEDGLTIAARGPDGRLTMMGDTDGFVATLWLKADADPRTNGKSTDADGAPSCDPVGCTLPLGDGRLARPHSARAVTEDCALAEVVVSVLRLPVCAAPGVVDRTVLRHHGATALTRGPDGTWHTTTARPNGPTRAWQIPADLGYD
ncbi:ComEC/Rec2 family competence protein [Acuticoccus yangtzensis]|uniref:ComEC/Rec2 family competence protein n=1 Tax=Acuticoccus yangtzensis TaxID=1443441 RepID=UPI000949935A|nr:ComEC/Rec2 family competence protein [Acuticoccus yangtzensis]